MRAATAFAVFFVGCAGSAIPALAQYYPAPQPGYQPPAYRQAPAVVAEDDDMPAYDPPPSRRNAPPGVYAAPPGVYAAPSVQETPLPLDARGRPIPPSEVEQYQQPAQRYGRAAPIQPEPDGYVPAPPPGYVAAPPGYVAPQQGYVAPQQGYVGQQQGYEVDQRGYARPYQPPPAQGGPYVAPGGQPMAAPPVTAAAPQAAPGSTYELQEAVRPPLAIGPGQQYQTQDPSGVVRSDPRSTMASLPADYRPETGPRKDLPPQFRRTMVDYRTKEPAGTIIVDTPSTYLYLVMGNGKAMRYGIGVGRDGFTWTGVEKVTRMAEWPDWHPPPEMIERQPYLPRFMAGGETNPLGARALYLGKTIYRIHGTNQPSTIGTFVSSGCIRLTNEDVEDLYTRVKVGTRVVVLPGVKPPATASAMPPNASPRPAPLPPPIAVR